MFEKSFRVRVIALAFALATTVMLLVGCSNKIDASEEAISIGKNAIATADRYLDGSLDAADAKDKLDDLYKRMDYLEEMTSDDEHYYEDNLVRTYILSLSSYVLIDNYGKIESTRNELAESVGADKR